MTYKPIYVRLVGPKRPSSFSGSDERGDASSSQSPPPPNRWTAFEYDVGSAAGFSDEPMRVPFGSVSTVSVTEDSSGLEFDIEYTRPGRRQRRGTRDIEHEGSAKTLRIRVNTLAEFSSWRQAFAPKLVVVYPRHHRPKKPTGAAGADALDRARAWLNQREGEGERQSSPSPNREEREPESQMLV